MWSVELSKQATTYFNGLPEQAQHKIRSRIDRMKANPFHYLERYVGDHYKIRFGEYRGLADVDFTERVVYSRYLEHRSQIYRKR